MTLAWKSYKVFDPNTRTHHTVEAAVVGERDWYDLDGNENKIRKTVSLLGHERHDLARGDVLVKTSNPHVYELLTRNQLEQWTEAEIYDEASEEAKYTEQWAVEDAAADNKPTDDEIAEYRKWKASQEESTTTVKKATPVSAKRV